MRRLTSYVLNPTSPFRVESSRPHRSAKKPTFDVVVTRNKPFLEENSFLEHSEYLMNARISSTQILRLFRENLTLL